MRLPVFPLPLIACVEVVQLVITVELLHAGLVREWREVEVLAVELPVELLVGGECGLCDGEGRRG